MHGANPLAMIDDKLDVILKNSLLAKTSKSGECLLWISDGEEAARRLSYQLFVGTIPKQLSVVNICRIKSCVNSSHLRPMSRIESLFLEPERAVTRKCRNGHPYSSGNVEIRKGCRFCKICKSEKNKRYRTKHLETYREKKKKYYWTNREKVRAHQREYYALRKSAGR